MTLVNNLWSDFVSLFGVDKAQKAISQSLDFQKINGNSNTIPLLFIETCGLALISIDSVSNSTGINLIGCGYILIYSKKSKSIQLIQA